jgi:hypothetical protein
VARIRAGGVAARLSPPRRPPGGSVPSPGRDGQAHGDPGRAPDGRFCIQIAISERFVHAWDLAAATCQSFGDDGADIAEALLASPEYLSVNSEVRMNTPPPLGPEITVEGGDAVERLVAFLGRDPSQASV